MFTIPFMVWYVSHLIGRFYIQAVALSSWQGNIKQYLPHPSLNRRSWYLRPHWYSPPQNNVPGRNISHLLRGSSAGNKRTQNLLKQVNIQLAQFMAVKALFTKWTHPCYMKVTDSAYKAEKENLINIQVIQHLESYKVKVHLDPWSWTCPCTELRCKVWLYLDEYITVNTY